MRLISDSFQHFYVIYDKLSFVYLRLPLLPYVTWLMKQGIYHGLKWLFSQSRILSICIHSYDLYIVHQI